VRIHPISDSVSLPLYSGAKGLNSGLVRINLWWFLQDSHHDIHACLRFRRFLVRNYWLVPHWCCQFQGPCLLCQNSQHEDLCYELKSSITVGWMEGFEEELHHTFRRSPTKIELSSISKDLHWEYYETP
jgi:hypothetical protein